MMDIHHLRSPDPLMHEPALSSWTRLVRDIHDFPKPGIVFKDITPMLADAEGFAGAIDTLAAPWRDASIEAIVAVEARGFIFGAPLARALGIGFVPVRKPGKLPGRTVRQTYALEYGEDTLEIHADALSAGARVLLIDDVLATGGTLDATRALVERLDARVIGAGVLIELSALHGRARWNGTAPLQAAWVV